MCGRCGLLAVPAAPRGRRAHAMMVRPSAARCQGCGREDTVRTVELPYAAKLLAQELEGMNIGLRLRFDD